MIPHDFKSSRHWPHCNFFKQADHQSVSKAAKGSSQIHTRWHHLGALSALSEEIRPFARLWLGSFCSVGWLPLAAVGDNTGLTCPLDGSAAHSKDKLSVCSAAVAETL